MGFSWRGLSVHLFPSFDTVSFIRWNPKSSLFRNGCNFWPGGALVGTVPGRGLSVHVLPLSALVSWNW